MVKGITREVDFSCLTIRESYTIVDDSCVTGTDATYRHRLHPPCTTIVAHANTSHVFQRIGHRMNSHANHIVAVNLL